MYNQTHFGSACGIVGDIKFACQGNSSIDEGESNSGGDHLPVEPTEDSWCLGYSRGTV